MKKWKKTKITLAVLALIISILVLVIALQPDAFKITRTATIAATPEKIFPHLVNLRAWDAWSPWAKLDPAMKMTFSGPESGRGAAYSWSGNDKVGEGTMTVLGETPGKSVLLKLDFKKPMEDTCLVKLDLAPAGDATTVTWTMTGKKGFLQKAFCMFMDMDKMVGGDFERGLANLKMLAEAKPFTNPALLARRPLDTAPATQR